MAGFIRTSAINQILRLKKRIKAIRGGTSAGKTFGILPILIDKAIKREGLEISVVSESVPHLKKGAMKDFIKIMKATGRWREDNWNATDRKYTFTNTSFIEFFSVMDEESARGARRHILYVNECNNIKFGVYDQLAIRTEEEIYLDWNPSHEFWADEEVVTDPDCDFITLTYLDNEALSEMTINELLKRKAKGFIDPNGDLNDLANVKDSFWANWWRVYGMGQTGSLEGVIFGKYTPVHGFPVNDKGGSECEWICYGLDFGFTNDVTALTKVGKKGDQIYLEQMIYQTGLLNSDINKLLKSFGIKREEVVADGANPKDIEELRRMGWNISKSEDKAIKNGIDIMKRYDYSIVATSLELIVEWRTYCWKKDKATNKYLNEPIDDFNHAIDGVRYVMRRKVGEQAKRSAPRATATKKG